jgi:hypothetical protein
MHEFLLDFAKWQKGKSMQDMMHVLKAKEDLCVKGGGDQAKCREPRNQVERIMYTK